VHDVKSVAERHEWSPKLGSVVRFNGSRQADLTKPIHRDGGDGLGREGEELGYKRKTTVAINHDQKLGALQA
jgi:hypothetical protein